MTNNFDLMEVPDIARGAQDGTESAMQRLYDGRVPRALLQEFQIIPTRMERLREDKYRILWIMRRPATLRCSILPKAAGRNSTGWHS
jgi:hypothetical protein